jgi:hypothetical protein
MSKARAPKRKEASYMSPDEIDVIRCDILEKGRVLETAIRKKFPDAEDACDAMEQLLGVVKQYKLVGKWVSSSATTKEIRKVSSFVYFIFLSFVISMSNYRVS